MLIQPVFTLGAPAAAFLMVLSLLGCRETAAKSSEAAVFPLRANPVRVSVTRELRYRLRVLP